MKKKFLSVFFCLCMVFALTPVTVFAAENTVDTWDGSVDTSWYDLNDVKESYDITTAEQLAGLAELVNKAKGPNTENFTGITFYLKNDLDLGGHEWTAIGSMPTASDYSAFYGNFDGQGHEIKNLTITSSKSNSQLGLFGGVKGGIISNLKIKNANIKMTMEFYAGTLICQAYQATILNCSTSGTLTTCGGACAGGLIGRAYGSKIIGCFSSATIIDNVTQWGENILGGIVGCWQSWETNVNNPNGEISDCYFDGQIIFSDDSDPEVGQAGLTGGILGYHYQNNNLTATDNVVVKNCMVTTSKIENAYTKTGQGNPPAWIMYNEESSIPQNCYWPDNDDGRPAAVVNFDDSSTVVSDCGKAVQDFIDNKLLDMLNTNATSNVQWVMGINHPTFSWDEDNISADYSKVDEAIAKAEAFNKENYKDFSQVETAIQSVIRGKNITEQDEVDAMAKAIEDAIAALEYNGADYSKVDEAITKAEALNKDNYKDFSQVETAIQSVVRGKNITEQAEVDAMAKAIEDAIAALEYKDADYSKVDEAIAKAEALNKDNYKDFSQVETAIQSVIRGKNITEQDEVDAMAKAIEDAIANLEKKTVVSSKPESSSESDKTSESQTQVTGGQTDKTTAIQTGDNNNAVLWGSLILISMSVVLILAIYRKKEER